MSEGVFGLRYPIFQAPTGSIAGPELAIAVTEAGGMGAMGLTGAEPGDARLAVERVRSATRGLFQGNFVLTFDPSALDAALEAGIPVVTFSWGDPSEYLAKVRAAGARVGVQVANVEGAKRALDSQVDFLICQGLEAGGHVQSTLELHRLLPEIVEVAGDVPVVAAGGIADGRGIAEALGLGAKGAMLGSRFVATRESRAHELYKQRLVEAVGADTSMTICFDGGWPQALHRVLRNGTLERWEGVGCPPAGRRPGEGDVLGLSGAGQEILRYQDTAPKQDTSGEILDMCLYAGQGCGAIHDVPSAGDLVERLWAEAKTYLRESGRHHP